MCNSHMWLFSVYHIAQHRYRIFPTSQRILLDRTILDILKTFQSLFCCLWAFAQAVLSARNPPSPHSPTTNTTLAPVNSYSFVNSPCKYHFLWLACPRPWTGLGVSTMYSHDTCTSLIITHYPLLLTFINCLASPLAITKAYWALTVCQTLLSALHLTLKATSFHKWGNWC